jgi:ATP-binding cassette subfamily A (ABC1) protein 3
LIDMLTGLLSPTSGTAWIRGKNIQTDVKEIQRELGLCPQSNAIYPELTVMQHLTMSAAFKSVPYEKIEATARVMMQEIGLEDKADVESSKLSGGMKRKLCLGMALTGDPKVVILDEPTSGMDPYSRRAVWDILQRHKRGRVILLTTHYMDEADHLGDRIAIMAKGRLQCCGSPLYLKNLHGVGYTLTIVRDDAADTNEDIQKLLQTFMPSAELLSIAGTELTFRLPSDSTRQYADVLSALDMHTADLGVLSYGIRLTMLEEVFLRVGRDGARVTPLQREYTAETKDALNEPYAKRADSMEGEKQVEMVDMTAKKGEDLEACKPLADHALWKSKRHEVSAFTAFYRHCEALFRKRATHAKRDVKMVACQLILPIAFMSMALALLQYQVDRDQPRLELSGNIQNRAIEPKDRNPVPFNGLGPVGHAIQTRFNTDNVKGYAVEMEEVPDQFDGCAQGGAELTNMSNYLIATIGPREEKGASRYGAVTIAQTASLSTFQYNVMVNGSSLHGAAIYPNLLHTALLQELLQDSGAEIRIASHPLPRTFRQEHTDASLSAFTGALLLLVAFAFIPVMYISFVVRERELKAKEQQFISGMSLIAYWTAMFVWDLLCYVIPVLITLGIWFAFSIKVSEGAFYAVLLVYGPCIITSTYALSFMFTSRATAENAALYFNMLTGFCLIIVSYLLVASPVTTGDSRFVRYLFRIFPSYCLGDGLMYLSFCLDKTNCPRITADGPDYNNPIGPMHWDIVLADITFMVILTVVNIIAIFSIEYVRVHPWFERLWDGDLSALQRTSEGTSCITLFMTCPFANAVVLIPRFAHVFFLFFVFFFC